MIPVALAAAMALSTAGIAIAEQNDTPPGIPLPATGFSDEVRTDSDPLDVFSVTLSTGDTLHLKVHHTNGVSNEDVALFPPGTTGVEDLSKAVGLSRNLWSVDDQIVYTVPQGMGGLYLIDVWANDGDFASYTMTWSVTTPAPLKTATISSSVGPSVVAYRGVVTVKAGLKTATGQTLRGRTLTLKRSYNRSTWTTQTVQKSLTGAYSASLRIDRKTYFRWQLAADSAYATATSAVKSSISRAYLTPPSFPSSMGFNHKYTGIGYLRPRHASGTVKVYEYYYRNGRWVLLDSTVGGLFDYSSYSRFVTWVTFWGSGSWRVRMRAYHADADHAPTYSAWRYYTVR